MLDFNKLKFADMDIEALPPLVTFEYSREADDIENFLLYNLGDEDVPEDDEIESIEFELFIFSKDDYKVECTLHGASVDHFVMDYIEAMHDASEWLEQIPENKLNQIKDVLR